MEEVSLVKKRFIRYIDNVIKNGKISHAYLIELDNYDIDFKYVLSFVKMILCNLSYEELEKSNNSIIQLIDNGNYPDLYIISSDNSTINKSMVLDLQKEFNNKSLLNGKRVYIIKEAEKLNSSSANTILKFLEEPEDDIIAFLLTTNRFHIIETIISRCQVIAIKEDYNKINYNDELMDFLDCVLRPSNFFIKYNYYMKELFVDKITVKKYIEDIEKILIDYIELGNMCNEEYKLKLECVSNKQIIGIISILENELPKLDFNLNLKLWVDSLFSKLIGGSFYD